MKDKLAENIKKFKNGEIDAFDCIYKDTYRLVYLKAFYYMRDNSLAEDITQETFIKAFKNINYYQDGTNFTAWLTTISKNLSLNYLKKYEREADTDFNIDSYKYGVEEKTENGILDTAVRVLSEEEYQIVTMCHISGYKRREVAELLKIPIGTVTWKNNEALKKLKIAYEKEVSDEKKS